MNISEHTSMFLWIIVLLSSFFLVNSAENKRSDDLSLESLQTLIQQQSAVIQQQSAVIQQQSAVNQQQAAELQGIQAKLTSLETQTQTRMNTFDSQIHKLQQKVAFHAFFFEGGNINIGASSPIAFDHLSYNLGNGYDTSSGVFTAPTAGVYLFLLSIKANTHGVIFFDVVKSGSIIIQTDIGATADNDKTTTFTIVHVNAGETVFVRHSDGPTVVDKWYDTAFAGILLYAD